MIGLTDGGISAPELDVVCVNESGRFEISVSNATDTVIPVEIATRYDTGRPFGQQRPVYRSFELEAGAARTQVITGRADGLHSIWVLAGTKALGVPEQPVDCQPDPTMVEVSVSCLAGRGRIDVVFPPTDGPPRPLYAVRYVGPKSTLERVRLGNELSTQVTVTGRENGEFSIEATIDGESAFDGVVTVACD